MDALLKLRDVADVDAGQCLALCLERLESANNVLTRFYEHMSPDLFGQFRVFYGKNPYKNTLGPSGRFSARIVAVSVLLVGEELFHQKPQFYRDLYRLSEYYPQRCIHEVFRWLSSGKGSAPLKPGWLKGKRTFPGLRPFRQSWSITAAKSERCARPVFVHWIGLPGCTVVRL